LETKLQWTDGNLLHFTQTVAKTVLDTKEIYERWRKKRPEDAATLNPSTAAVEYSDPLYWCSNGKCLLIPSSEHVAETYVLFPETAEVFILKGKRMLTRENEMGILEADLLRVKEAKMEEVWRYWVVVNFDPFWIRRYELALPGVASRISVEIAMPQSARTGPGNAAGAAQISIKGDVEGAPSFPHADGKAPAGGGEWRTAPVRGQPPR
jgi:hypothetical protein